MARSHRDSNPASPARPCQTPGMAAETVRHVVEQHIATVTIDRPEHRNALDQATVECLREHLGAVAEDRNARVVVLTGAGKDFCVGGDVAGLTPTEGRQRSSGELRALMEVSELLVGMPQITIAAISGACAGAGMGFAAACDLRLAAASAVFATAFLRVGVSGDHGTIWSVTRAVGPSRARALFLLGDRFGAAQAREYGLVHRVLPDEDLLPGVREVATRLTSQSPSALRVMKENLNDALLLPLADYLDREVERFAAVSRGPHAAEAALAFLEKRPAVFNE